MYSFELPIQGSQAKEVDLLVKEHHVGVVKVGLCGINKNITSEENFK